MTTLNLHATRTALQTIGQYVARTFKPDSAEWQALDALWADMEAREARGDFRAERQEYDGDERHQMQEFNVLRILRNVPTTAGQKTMRKRELTQRLYNIAAFRHDPANRPAAIKATFDRLTASGKISVVNELVTLLE